LVVAPAGFDNNVLSLHEACFVQALTKGREILDLACRPATVESPITGSGCCAQAANGKIAAPPNPAIKFLRRMSSPE
jgi:hypothetical protein